MAAGHFLILADGFRNDVEAISGTVRDQDARVQAKMNLRPAAAQQSWYIDRNLWQGFRKIHPFHSRLR